MVWDRLCFSFREEVFAVRDSQSSLLLACFFYAAHTFRMQAFFLIAGYFAHLLYHRRGALGFLQHRVKRILLPFLLFLPVMHILLCALRIWGHQRMGLYDPKLPIATMSPWRATFQEMFSRKWYQPHLSPEHLWFLYYLFMYCVAVLLVRPLWVGIDQTARLRRSIDKALAYLLGRWWGSAVFSAVVLIPMSAMKNGFGVDTPDAGLRPVAPPFVLFGLFFTFGWFLHRQPDLIGGFKKHWRSNLIVSSVLIAGLTFFYLHMVSSLDQLLALRANKPATFICILLAYNSVYAFASTMAVFAFIGLVIRFFHHPSKRIRYLSDSSYWLYIAHLPVVIFFQILVAPLSLHWLLKLPLIFVPSFTIMFITYHYGVRNTWVGVLLNGRRYPRNPPTAEHGAMSLLIPA